ncbi:MAG: ABC transporter permease [Ignavibacteria bacterium]|nr:ABC transporter permease [Ignavibacteria bacterium]
MSRIIFHLVTFRESLLMALTAIRTNKLRTVLTMLGIVVGVFSIIAVMTAMGVLRNSIEQGLTQLGASTFQIQKHPAGFNSGHRNRTRNRKDITYEQGLAVWEKTTLAEAVGLEVWQFGRIVWWEGQKTNPNVSLAGENPEGLVTNNWGVERGRGFNKEDMDLRKAVIILGQAVAEKLFPPRVNPLGESVKVDGVLYEVIGIFESKGSALGGNNDNFAAVPLPRFFDTYGKRARSVNIMVKAQSQEVFEDCLEQARGVLRTARKVDPGEEDDFAFFSNDSVINSFNDFTADFRLGVLVISSIALLAAGVGIMNIMLVSVTERTREIGIRKAIGAQKSDILSQFILEAIILCQIGGFAGVFLGVVAGNAASILFEVPAIIPWEWVGIGFGVCSLVGLIFGVYPAWKAAVLDPIEALRYE